MSTLLEFSSSVNATLQAINDVLTAAIALTAFSLLIFAFAFRSHDRLTRSFTVILACITIVYAAAAFALIPQSSQIIQFLLHLYWIGLVILPAGYFNFSDALLTLTGRPSRGRRKIVSLFTIIISVFFLFALAAGWLVKNIVINSPPAPFLLPSFLNGFFALYFGLTMLLAWYNMVRAINRSVTTASRRRMIYLVIGAAGPAIGSFPYLIYGTEFARANLSFFWLLSIIANLVVGVLTVVFSYAVSFYGFPWPDRLIKTRLFRWLMRGPITASLTLGATTLVRRLGDLWGVDLSAVGILVMVGSIILLEFLIILFAPIWERIFFSGKDRKDLEVIRSVGERMLSQNDLHQFLEMILAVICDRVQAKGAFLCTWHSNQLNLLVEIGKTKIKNELFQKELSQFLQKTTNLEKQVEWKGILLIMLYRKDESGNKNVVGAIGVYGLRNSALDDEQQKALNRLASRAATALKDRHIQEEILTSLQVFTPQVSVIQNLLAAGRFDSGRVLSEEIPLKKNEVDQWVKDALTHLWGGPKLSQSPLLQFSLVQRFSNESEEMNSSNALREILRTAIQSIRPVGERQYTNEWVLFNILDLKFIEGMKVKDIARRLSLSEADLYRKQRVAISAISTQIIRQENRERSSR